jgi:hypothetical protein
MRRWNSSCERAQPEVTVFNGAITRFELQSWGFERNGDFTPIECPSRLKEVKKNAPKPLPKRTRDYIHGFADGKRFALEGMLQAQGSVSKLFEARLPYT